MTADVRALLDLVRSLSRDAHERPLKYLQWLPGQHRFLSDPSRRKLLRAGNQAHGKTTAGLAEVHFKCVGAHPFLPLVHDPPIEAWVVCASWSQSVAIQQKFWDLTGRTGALAADTVFDPLRGFRGKNPAVMYRNGSVVRFRTTMQGGLNLSGATIHHALFDEPPCSARVYGEVQKRVLRTAGTVALTLTPINAPVDWLREAVEAGRISDTHVRLEAANMIPVSSSRPLCLEDGTPMDEAWIESVLLETLGMEIPVVCHGEWELRVEGRTFTAWDTTRHISADLPAGSLVVCVGLDHGDGENFSQVAVLVAVDDTGDYPRVAVLDEYISPGTTTPDMDAAGAVAMLSRSGLGWASVDRAHVDRKYGGRRNSLSKKSNAAFIRALGRVLKTPAAAIKPEIRTVKRGKGHGRGSVDHGCRFLHQCMVRPGHFQVHPRCTRLIESLNRWDYRDNEYKHAIDALRYALDSYIFRKTRRAGTTPVHLYG